MHSNPILYPEINPQLCVRCGACGEVCPTGAVSDGDGIPVHLNEACACDLCGACENICPTGAINVPFTIQFI